MDKEKLVNRPAGGREGDLGELNDWTVTDIATSPKTSKADRKNAEAEITRRKEAGTYNPDDDPQEIEDDLQSHGYGIENGEILYPTPEYKAWLNSDRKKPAPEGQLRETIADRLAAAAKQAARERETYQRERQRNFGDEAIQALITEHEDEPMQEKILHPAGSTRERDLIKRQRKAAAKARTLERVYEERFEALERPELSTEQRFNRALDYAKRRFDTPDQIDGYYEEGALARIEKGIFRPNNDYIFTGFKALEGAKIDDIADSEDDSMVWNAIAENVPLVNKERLKALEKDAVGTAIEIGAYRKNTGITGRGEITYTLPLDIIGAEKLNDTLADFGLGYQVITEEDKENNPDKVADIIDHNEKIYSMFESGFVGVIDLLKDGDLAGDEHEYDMANWYYDHLLSGHKKEEVIESVKNKYVASENDDFVDKLDQFIVWRAEKEHEALRNQETMEPIDDRDVTILDTIGKETEFSGSLADFVPENFIKVIKNDPNLAQIIDIFPLLGKRNYNKKDDDGSVPGTNIIVDGEDVGPGPNVPVKGKIGYGLEKYIQFINCLVALSQRSDFSASDKWINISRPFHIHRDANGKWVSELAHYDEKRGCFVDDRTNHKVANSSIRLYIGAEFKLGDEDRYLAESVTDATERFYVSLDDAAKNHRALYGKDKQYAMVKDANGSPLTFRFNHTPFKLNGVKGLHGFQRMYTRILAKIG